MKFRRRVLLVLAIMFVKMSDAAPADWYWWRSKISEAQVCSQTSPGNGWERAGGPYWDARCERLKKTKSQ